MIILYHFNLQTIVWMRMTEQSTIRKNKDDLFEGFAVVGRALASGRRIEILDVLAQAERSVEDIATELGQSTAATSHHLRFLAKSGLLRSTRRGKQIIYRIAGDEIESLWRSVRAVATTHVSELNGLAGDYLGDRSGIGVISQAELVKHLRRGDVTVIDVRPLVEYEAGHIPGARWVAPVGAIIRDIPRGSHVVAYCRGPYCAYADDAVRRLTKRGVRASRLEDGFPEWRRAGLPVAKGKEER